MSYKGGRSQKQNRLWTARKRRGLGQKQVAYLLDTSIDEISRCERGVITPGLEIALGLEIVYGLPVRLLFKDLYKDLQSRISERVSHKESLKRIYEGALGLEQKLGESCTFQDLLQIANLSGVDAAKIRDHITHLAKKLAYL
jgi:transcriptional regulator with XRE-family HTH domain